MKRASLTTLALALAATTAWAEPIPAKAKTLAQQGRAFHDKGDYAHAIAAFKEAYVIAPSPALLFNLAQAYRLSGNCDDAALMYRRYIGTYPAPDGRALAEGHLSTVERCISKRSLNIPMDQETAYLDVPHPPTDLGIIDEPAPRDPGRFKRNLGMGLGAAGGVALLAAAYYGKQAHDAAEQVERMSKMGARWKDIQPVDERGAHAATTAKAFAVTGALAAAGGVTLYLLGRHEEHASSLAIVPTGKGAQVSYAWQW